MPATFQGDNGSFFKHVAILMVLLFFAFLGIGAFFNSLSQEMNSVGFLFSVVGGISGCLALIYPIYVSSNVSSKIPEIEKYNQTCAMQDKPEIKIAHPKRTLIFILVFAGFFTFGFLWIAALWVASGHFNAAVPDNILKEIGFNAVGREGQGTNANELISLKKLLDEDVITEQQYETEKEKLGF